MSWFSESNRWKHFVLGIPCGFFLTTLFGAGIATGMEFKDVHHDNGNKPIRQWSWRCWDWIDWLCTVCGSLIGGFIRTGIILLIIK